MIQNDPSSKKKLSANPARKPETAGMSAPLVDKGEIGEFAKTAIIAVLLAFGLSLGFRGCMQVVLL